MALNRHILVVDDDEAIRLLLTTIFRRRGLHVDAARNGIEAVELMEESLYAVMLLDLMMPRLNGYGVLDYLRRFDVASRPRVIVLTAGIDASAAFDPQYVAATMYKPFDLDRLIPLVTSCLLPLPAQLDAVAPPLYLG